MTTISIKYETTPASAKSNAQLHVVWLIQNDAHNPHAKFEDKEEPWTVEVDSNKEYSVYFHATLPGASLVTVTAGDRVKPLPVDSSGIVQKTFYLIEV